MHSRFYFPTILTLVLFVGFSAFAQKAELVEEAGRPVKTREEVRSRSSMLENRSLADIFRPGDYSSIESLRADRRVTVGAESFGRLGLIGINVELNYGPLDGALVGIGGGPGYNALSLGWKHLFGGKKISPYTAISYSRWSGSSRASFDGTSPAFLEQKFLSENEKKSGQFGKDFLAPALGIQFNQLQGPSAGAALYAEVLALIEASSFVYVPTGALGALYSF